MMNSDATITILIMIKQICKNNTNYIPICYLMKIKLSMLTHLLRSVDRSRPLYLSLKHASAD